MTEFNNRTILGAKIKIASCLGFLLCAVSLAGSWGDGFKANAWQANNITPDHGLVDGGIEAVITGDFDLETKVIKMKDISNLNIVLALDDKGQLYAWGESDTLGIGAQNMGYCWNTDNSTYAQAYATQIDCLSAGIDYNWQYGSSSSVPRNINQAAAGDVTSDTVIVDIFYNENSSSIFALDDHGQLYVWGFNIGLGGLQTCNFTQYTSQIDCEDNNGYWSDFLYAPLSINRVAAGDITMSTHIDKVFPGRDGGPTYAVDNQGQLYGWSSGNFGDGQGEQDYYAPVNISQTAAGDILPSTIIVDVVNSGSISYAIDADGRLYVWGSDDANGLGATLRCSDSQYTTEASCQAAATCSDPMYTSAEDCQNNWYWWFPTWEMMPNIVNVDVPVSINVAATGSITAGTKIVDIEIYDDGYGGILALDSWGQLHTWTGIANGGSAFSGLGIAWFCYRSPVYTNQADCEAANQIWTQDYVQTYNVPVNINQVAVGSITDSTVVESVSVAREQSAAFAIDSTGQLHAWGSLSEGIMPFGREYTYDYCHQALGDNPTDCQNNGGDYYGDTNIPVPVSANQVAAGDITTSTHIESLSLAGYVTMAAYAFDDQGQIYAWGSNSNIMGLGNACSIAEYNYDEQECQDNGGQWDASRADDVVYDTPINLSQPGSSNFANVAMSIVSITGYSELELQNIYALDSAGYIHVWGSNKHTFGVSPCSIASEWFDDQQQCLDAGGVWQATKYLYHDDFSPLTINKSRTGDLGPVGYQVLFGTVASSSVVTLDEHTLKAITPAHAAGTVDVTISDGTTPNILHQAFTYQDLYINLTLNSGNMSINSTPDSVGVFSSGSNVSTVRTNNPQGYSLSLSTNKPSTDPNPSAMTHPLGNYLSATTNTCAWDADTKIFTDAATALPNNTWGFTLDSVNLSDQKFCQVPSSTSPLTVKSTTTDNNEIGDNTTFYYGVKVDLNQLAGQYRADIIYTAVANL
jgi:alpha-tubulin suppressor-like RCC1 family protein